MLWMTHKTWDWEADFRTLSYLPTPPLEQHMTQGQFLSGVEQVWIQSFPSLSLVATRRQKKSVWPTIYFPIKAFIKAFLSDGKFQARIGSTLSNIQNQEKGVQSIASPIAWFTELISICFFMISASPLDPNIYVQQNINYNRASAK